MNNKTLNGCMLSCFGLIMILFGIIMLNSGQAKTETISPDILVKTYVGDTTSCAECPWLDPDCFEYNCETVPGSPDRCASWDDWDYQEDIPCNPTGNPSDSCERWDLDTCWLRETCDKSPGYPCDQGPLSFSCTTYHNNNCVSYTHYSYDNCGIW
jgi:hypothetical protein